MRFGCLLAVACGHASPQKVETPFERKILSKGLIYIVFLYWRRNIL